jgi:hypothetical protein
LIALAKASRGAPAGFEDDAGFHYYEEALDSAIASARVAEMQSARAHEHVEHEQAA